MIMLSLSPKFWILTEGLGQFFVKLSSTAMVWKLHLRLVLKKLLKKKVLLMNNVRLLDEKKGIHSFLVQVNY